MDSSATTYEKLARPFDHVFHDSRGDFEFDYITGEQCISRLNEVLGFYSWSFKVLEHGIDSEADEVWVRAQLSVDIAVREQFGSQKIKRSRASGQPLDLGFDLKGATTDALKKCASLFGVGLYLSRKDAPDAEVLAPAVPVAEEKPVSLFKAAPVDDLTCVDCGVALTDTRFRDGTIWSPSQLAGYGRRKHNRILCMEHYKAANEARRRSERALEEVPF